LPIFAFFALRPYLVYAGQQSPLFNKITIIPIIKQSLFASNVILDKLALFILPPANFLLTVFFLLFVDLGIVFLFAFLYYLFGNSEKKLDSQQRMFGMYTLIIFAVSVLVLFQMRSSGGNDLFMRGIIVLQITMAITATLFLERINMNKYVFSIFLIVIALVQGMGVYVESSRLKHYTRVAFPPLYTYIRETLPKNAVLFTNIAHSQGYFECPGVTFQANRMCFMNYNEIIPPREQYAKNLHSDTRNFHDLNVVKEIDFPNKYYLSSEKNGDASLALVWTDDHSYLYEIHK
jgi:hypothetical protein